MLQYLSSSLSIFCFSAPFSSVLPFFSSFFFCSGCGGASGDGKLGRAEGGRETGGSCCDGGSAVVLLLCYVFLPLSVFVFASFSVSHGAGAVSDD